MADEITAEAVDRRRILGELAAYFGLTFAIIWSLGALILLARSQLEAVVGPIHDTSHHWLHYLAVRAPTISAMTVSLAFGGWAGLKALAAWFVRPFRPIWIVAAALGGPIAYTLAELALRAEVTP